MWNYYRDKVHGAASKNDDINNRINNNRITASKWFEYKTKLIESTPNNNSRLNAEVIVQLKYFSMFWRFLNLPLINCKEKFR